MVARPSWESALSYYRHEAWAESACSSCTRASPGGTCLPLVIFTALVKLGTEACSWIPTQRLSLGVLLVKGLRGSEATSMGSGFWVLIAPVDSAISID